MPNDFDGDRLVSRTPYSSIGQSQGPGLRYGRIRTMPNTFDGVSGGWVVYNPTYTYGQGFVSLHATAEAALVAAVGSEEENVRVAFLPDGMTLSDGVKWFEKACQPEDPNDRVEGHTSETMDKVYSALRDAGVEADEVTDVVNAMQNRGILFRELVERAE